MPPVLPTAASQRQCRQFSPRRRANGNAASSPHGGERSNAANSPCGGERSNAAANALPQRGKRSDAAPARTLSRSSTAHLSPCGEPKAMPHSPAGTGEPSTVTRAPRSRARLLPLTKRRIPVAKPRTPHPIPQAAQLFKLQSRNGRGRGGRPLVLSLGGSKGGYSLSRKRISLFFRMQCHRRCHPPAQVREHDQSF